MDSLIQTKQSAMAKIIELRITKPNGSTHYAPASGLNMREIPRQMKNEEPARRSRVEKIEVEVAPDGTRGEEVVLEVIVDTVIAVNAKAELEAKDAKIAELEAKLAAQAGAGEGDKGGPVTAAELVKQIKAAETVESVGALAEGDTRASVIKAAAERIVELG